MLRFDEALARILALGSPSLPMECIALEDADGRVVVDDLFAHASVSDGVTFSSLESKYYSKRFVGARRVVH